MTRPITKTLVRLVHFCPKSQAERRTLELPTCRASSVHEAHKKSAVVPQFCNKKKQPAVQHALRSPCVQRDITEPQGASSRSILLTNAMFGYCKLNGQRNNPCTWRCSRKAQPKPLRLGAAIRGLSCAKCKKKRKAFFSLKSSQSNELKTCPGFVRARKFFHFGRRLEKPAVRLHCTLPYQNPKQPVVILHP